MASTVCDSLCGTSAHISPKAQANGSLLGPGVLAVQYREGSIATMWVFRTATVSRWRRKPNGHRLTPQKRISRCSVGHLNVASILLSWGVYTPLKWSVPRLSRSCMLLWVILCDS
ncbi:hypothetical protein FOTG_02725 [Fusarium oxysporum f. sp. vasinfectum 25433]|uniref:Uncharacterized protein n=1 Tax=Fusarium oxysporum f. sp. vasinfectum 25433 TaxID=1089449 RepID=X0MG13_FUSOX|nr:hypothetical protein FOTG_02725 [Fusarium oxysporum f. sp. vasinfectum 25433]